MEPNSTERPVRVGLISLGCAKNLVDAEVMVGTLLRDGIEITNDARQADVVIVNTCSFIDSAQEESVDTILESAGVRDSSNRDQGLIVSGCLPQRFRDELPKLLPEVDAFIGIDQVPRISSIVKEALARREARLKTTGKSADGSRRAEVVGGLARLEAGRLAPLPAKDEYLRGTKGFGQKTTVAAPGTKHATREAQPAPLIEVNLRPRYIPDYATPRFRLTPRHFAYLKIAEGCNHPCSFCIIPRMRGATAAVSRQTSFQRPRRSLRTA